MIKEILMKAGKVLVLSALGLVLFASALELFGLWHDEWSGYNASLVVSDGICNIAVIPVNGEIIGYENAYSEAESYNMVSPEDVRMILNKAKEDPLIRGVLVRIDSVGGSPVGGEVISRMLKDTSYPVVALTGDVAASSGYLIATGADTIISSPLSDIGSIGVTMSYLTNFKQNEYDGLEYVSLTSAPFKDYMSPNKPLTDEERSLLERDLKIYHDAFVAMVSENRNLPLEDVAQLADGASMPANLALEAGLIDALGNESDARAWFAETLNLPLEEVILCE